MHARLVFVLGLLAASSTAWAGFECDYALDEWTAERTYGTDTFALGITGDETTGVFSYNATDYWYDYDLVTFSMIAPEDTSLTFDWTYAFLHSWYWVYADLYVFADGPDGTQTQHPVEFFNAEYTGEQTFTGSATLDIHEGYEFGFIVGGSNYDWSQILRGSVTVTNIEGMPSDADCDGVPDDEDGCPDTVAGDLVDAYGCSIDQYCPCDGGWSNHGGYVSCHAHAVEDFVLAGLLTVEEGEELQAAAGGSSCGKAL